MGENRTAVVEHAWVQSSADELRTRAGRTLALMQRWGYAPRIDTLASQLLEGPVENASLRKAVDRGIEFTVRDGFVCLRGSERLLARSKDRIERNARLAEEGWRIARSYAADLVRICPSVQCVGLSGSLASGGFGPHDDIDFDLIVDPGTKYTSYLIAHIIGLKYSWRYRRRQLDELHHTPLLPKITCINVVWTKDQTRPFQRRDENMAFELMRCIPIFGVRTFETMLDENPWIRDYFPQTYRQAWPEEVRGDLTAWGRVLQGVRRNPRMAQVLERVSRRIAWLLYREVQHSRNRNPEAVARMEFLRRAKYPYEVFQD